MFRCGSGINEYYGSRTDTCTQFYFPCYPPGGRRMSSLDASEISNGRANHGRILLSNVSCINCYSTVGDETTSNKRLSATVAHRRTDRKSVSHLSAFAVECPVFHRKYRSIWQDDWLINSVVCYESCGAGIVSRKWLSVSYCCCATYRYSPQGKPAWNIGLNESPKQTECCATNRESIYAGNPCDANSACNNFCRSFCRWTGQQLDPTIRPMRPFLCCAIGTASLLCYCRQVGRLQYAGRKHLQISPAGKSAGETCMWRSSFGGS